MISVLFAASIVVAWICLRKKRELKRRGADRLVKYSLYAHSLEFFGALAAVLLFYHVLLLFLSAGWQHVTVSSLLWLERALGGVQRYVARWSPGWAATLLILCALYLLGLLRIRLFRSDRPLRAFKAARTILRLANIVLVLLCSFTLLGSQLGQPAAILEVRIRTLRDNYGLLRRNVEEGLAGEVANRLYDKVRVDLGPRYTTVPAVLAETDARAGALREHYASFRKEYGARDSQVEQALRGHETRQRMGESAARRVGQPMVQPEGERAPFEGNLPEGVSYRNVANANAAANRFHARAKLSLVKFLSQPAGREIALHTPSLLTGELTNLVLQPLFEAYPALKPAIEVLSSTLNDAAKSGIGREIDRLTQTAIENPAELERIISEAGQRISDSARVQVTGRHKAEAEREVRSLERNLAELRILGTGLEQRGRALDNARIEDLLAQLRSADAATRERAAQELSGLGRKLTREHVNRLVDMMSTGTREWVTSQEREEGHHCTWYGYTSIKYYAGRALERMESPHVTASVSSEARRAISGGTRRERVTDPGWV